MNYNIDYWKKYYTEKNIKTQESNFAKYILTYVKEKQSILDICCGDGIDSTYFLNNNLDVYSFDVNFLENTKFNFKQFDLHKKTPNFSYDKSFDNVYCRFVLHAIPENLEDYILISANHVLNKDGLFFIEARSDKGQIPENSKHYRRLINSDTLISKLKNINFEINYFEEKNNFSIYNDENPILIRIVAKKMSNINVSGENFKTILIHSANNNLNNYNAKHLLLTTKKILDRHNIPFLLVFGTLLGAYRENNFISHDTDVDILIFDEDRKNVQNIINQGYFGLYDIRLVRSQAIINSLSFNKTYIDLYYFTKKLDRYRCAGHYIENVQIDNGLTTINFLNEEFKTVKNIEKYLEDKYGKDWKIPIKNKHART